MLENEVCVPVSAETRNVVVICPSCEISEVQHAEAWPTINLDGVFIVSPIVTYGVTCSACHESFAFRPTHVEVHREARP